MKAGVEASLTTFVELVGKPTASTAQRDELCRRLGRFEAYEGRSLEFLQSAFRIGARVALRRAKTVAQNFHISPALLLSFADALFAYIEVLDSLAREGYLEAKSGADEEPQARRRRLLRLILAGSAVPHPAVSELAERAGWPIPEEVTLVAVSADRKPDLSLLSDDVLVALDDPHPHLLVPGPFSTGRHAMLETALVRCRAAIGLNLPIGEAADSLRWARQTLTLVEAGVVDDGPVVVCEDHLVSLWLLADPGLIEQLARRQLAPLAEHTPTRRERLIETMRLSLTTRANAVELAESLNVHPQTVRYRLRNLDTMMEEQLNHPDQRFATEVVLRALQLRERASVLQRPRRHGLPGSG
jgi:hypothetical protein